MEGEGGPESGLAVPSDGAPSAHLAPLLPLSFQLPGLGGALRAGGAGKGRGKASGKAAVPARRKATAGE